MPTKDTTHLRIRIEARLLARLEKAAEKNHRTLTGEITERLEQSFQKDDGRLIAVSAAAEVLSVTLDRILTRMDNVLQKTVPGYERSALQRLMDMDIPPPRSAEEGGPLEQLMKGGKEDKS